MNAQDLSRIKVVSLAAGHATRLRPLTFDRPKAAVPLMGVASLHYCLYRLEGFGFTQVAINSHHAAHCIDELVKTYRGDLKIHKSHEPEILGSGGALYPLKSWLGEDPFLMVNPDIVTDIDLAAFSRAHMDSRAIATLAVIAPDAKHPQGTVWCDGKTVKQISKHAPDPSLTCRYGIAIFAMNPEFLHYISQPGFSNLSDAINTAIAAGERVEVFHHGGYFADLGDSLADYIQVHCDLIANRARLFHDLEFPRLLRQYHANLWMVQSSSGEINGCIAEQAMEPGLEIEASSKDFFVFAPSLLSGQCKLQCCLLSSADIRGEQQVADVVIVDQHRARL